MTTMHEPQEQISSELKTLLKSLESSIVVSNQADAPQEANARTYLAGWLAENAQELLDSEFQLDREIIGELYTALLDSQTQGSDEPVHSAVFDILTDLGVPPYKVVVKELSSSEWTASNVGENGTSAPTTTVLTATA